MYVFGTLNSNKKKSIWLFLVSVERFFFFINSLQHPPFWTPAIVYNPYIDLKQGIQSFCQLFD